jgi:hypothetical protein
MELTEEQLSEFVRHMSLEHIETNIRIMKQTMALLQIQIQQSEDLLKLAKEGTVSPTNIN